MSRRASGMTALGVRRGKAASFGGCESHPATIAPAGSNRSSHGGNEVAKAFGIACRELVSLDFRCGSNPEVQREPQNVGSWGQSRHPIWNVRYQRQSGSAAAWALTSAVSHLWTAPCWQGIFGRFCSAGRCCPLFGLFVRRSQMAAGHNALRRSGPGQKHAVSKLH